MITGTAAARVLPDAREDVEAVVPQVHVSRRVGLGAALSAVTISSRGSRCGARSRRA